MDRDDFDREQKGRVYASQIVEITTDSRDDEPGVIAFTEQPGSRPAGSRAPPTDVAVGLLLEHGFL